MDIFNTILLQNNQEMYQAFSNSILFLIIEIPIIKSNSIKNLTDETLQPLIILE